MDERITGLALTRRKHEAILIGENIRVEVARIDSKAVRLYVTAPRSTTILREELNDEYRRLETR